MVPVQVERKSPFSLSASRSLRRSSTTVPAERSELRTEAGRLPPRNALDSRQLARPPSGPVAIRLRIGDAGRHRRALFRSVLPADRSDYRIGKRVGNHSLRRPGASRRQEGPPRDRGVSSALTAGDVAWPMAARPRIRRESRGSGNRSSSPARSVGSSINRDCLRLRFRAVGSSTRGGSPPRRISSNWPIDFDSAPKSAFPHQSAQRTINLPARARIRERGASVSAVFGVAVMYVTDWHAPRTVIEQKILGRRRAIYNKRRQRLRMLRQMRLLRYVDQHGLCGRGWRKRAAEELGVSYRTILRDMTFMFRGRELLDLIIHDRHERLAEVRRQPWRDEATENRITPAASKNGAKNPGGVDARLC